VNPNGNPRDLTMVAQDYLKVIWTAQEWSHEKVSTKMLAERIGVSASTASESIRKLADQGLVDHEKYGAVTLTAAGRAVADALAYNDVDYLALEPDHDRFQTALADGYHVHRANPADPRSWDAIGMDRRQVLVIATGATDVSRELTPLVETRAPTMTRIIAVPGAEEIDDMAALGMLPVDMSMSGGGERLIELVFTALDIDRNLPVPGLARDDEAMPRAA